MRYFARIILKDGRELLGSDGGLVISSEITTLRGASKRALAWAHQSRLPEHRGSYLRLDVHGGDSMYGAPLRSLEWSLEE